MNKSRWKKKILIWDFICLILLNSLDRLSKIAAEYYCNNENFVLVKNILEITYIKNTGGAFGIEAGLGTTIICVVLGAALLLIPQKKAKTAETTEN